MHRPIISSSLTFIIILVLITVMYGCIENKSQGLDPQYIMENFFESWQDEDFNEMWKYTHPNIIKLMKRQKLMSKKRQLSNQELFSLTMKSALKKTPSKKLRTYTIQSIQEYKKGDKIIWVTVIINGKEMRLPLILHGKSLKVDLTKLK